MLKIGIFIQNFEELQNWELRIIEGIKNNPELELTLLVKDGRIKQDSKNTNKSFSSFFFSKQVSFEKRRYLNNKQTINKEEIIEFLGAIPSIVVNPKKENDFDIFTEEELQKIKNCNLDVFLKHGFDILSGEILNTAKYGIWLLIHGSNSVGYGPPGLWELSTRQPVVEVMLIQLTPIKNQGTIIDKAYFNRHKFSFVETNIKVLESSVSLLFKNLKNIESNKLLVSDFTLNNYSFDDVPGLRNTLRYSFNYFKGFFRGFQQKIYGCFGKRSNHWTLFIGNGNFLEADLTKIRPVKVPEDEFWADPFLFKYQDDHYVFFENYSYKTGIGKISCGKVENKKLINIVDVLDMDYHLSYPFIFKEDGEIYMMPETSSNKRLEVYKCKEFPDKWELFTTAFEGEEVVDAFFYNDKLNQKWLFINKIIAPKVDGTSELYIYKVDSIRLEKLEPHRLNPVIIDARVARNGGTIFKYQNKTYRPSQSNTDGVYGKALNINQIKKLTIEEYQEETIRMVEPNFQKSLVSMHHLHQIDEMFVFDGVIKYSYFSEVYF